MTDTLDLNKLEDSAAGRAIAAVAGAQPIFETFVDFTTNLVRNVIMTAVQMAMEQLEAYAEIVAKVSGTLADYEQRMFPDLDGDTQAYIDEYVQPKFGEGTWPTQAQVDMTPVALVTDAISGFRATFSGITATFDMGDGAGSVDHVLDDVLLVAVGPPETYTIVPAYLFHFARAKLRKDIKLSYDKLVMLLKLGMQKIVITEGRISTSLAFSVHSEDTDKATSSSSDSTGSSKSSTWGASLGMNFIGKSFALGLRGSYGGSKSSTVVSVKATDTERTASTSVDVAITGGMELRFKSDYFPSIDPSTIALAP